MGHIPFKYMHPNPVSTHQMLTPSIVVGKYTTVELKTTKTSKLMFDVRDSCEVDTR
jgi:hypothetical protein